MSTRTEIGTLGEFGLIDRLSKEVKTYHTSTLKGIGDDAAVVDRGDYLELISTDMLVEGVHFDMSYTPLKHLGYKAVAVNASDIAAMNGLPEQITVSIAISNRFSVEALEELYQGINAACEAYNIDLVGGDTTSSLSGLIISVTAIGRVDKDKIAYRSGAKEGDVVCVTGDLGAAYLGLQLLEREKEVFLSNPDMQPELDGKDYMVESILKPEARLDLVHELKEYNIVPTSMIDVSDGLASEVMHIATKSDVGIVIFEENLPIDMNVADTALDFKIGPTTCAMNGGEDYEILFTLNKEDFKKVEKHAVITAIGQVVPKTEGIYLTTKANNRHDIKAQGWNHFDNDKENS